MADPVAPLPNDPIAAAAHAEAPAAVVEPSVAVEPVVASTVAPEPAPAVVEPAPAEAVVEEVKPHTETASLLEEAGAAKVETPAEAPKAADATQPAAPTYGEFDLPEGLTLEPAKMASFTEVLGKARVPQEMGQELLNLHTAALQEYALHTATQQHRTFADTRSEWREQIKSDERMGGAAFQTTQAAVARMRDMFVPSTDRDSFNEFLRVTGAGDHPAFWRLLHNAARHFDEPTPPPPNPQPPPDRGGVGKGRGRSALYDHPSSRVRA